MPIPEAERPSYHLSTLFPPVRPRGGYLEVRYLDAQPPRRIGEAVATVAALLYDARARHDALDLLLPRAGDQQRAWAEAATGFSPEADALLSIARARTAMAQTAVPVPGQRRCVMKIAFVADPLDRLDPSIDTTVGLMHAAQDRGAEVWVTQARLLEAAHGRARALRPPGAARAVPAGGDHRWTVAQRWFTAAEPQRVWLDEMAAVFMRTEPPLDQTYLTATLILDLVDPGRTALINDPGGLRACSEHLLPLRFPDLIPPTIVTADERTIRSFLAEHQTAVVKPVDGFSGRGVLRLDRHDPNLGSLIEISTQGGARAVVVQRFLREVAAGNKRIFVIAGEPAGAVYRFPRAGDFRIGDPAAEAPVTARDREICARLAPTLRRHGIHLAGLDVIGPYLIEVNVTSVGALRKADALLGWTLCADLLDSVLGPRTREKEIGMTTALPRHHLHGHPGRDAVPARAQRLADARRDREGGGSQFPNDPASRLLIAIRAHGNAAEYIPVLIVLFLLVGARSPAAVAIPLIVGATAARVVHAYGLLTAPSLAVQTKARLAGAVGTYFLGVGLAVAAAFSL